MGMRKRKEKKKAREERNGRTGNEQHKYPDTLLGQRATTLVHVLLQVLVEVLEHKRQLLLRVDHVVEALDGGRMELLQDRDLADRRAGHALVLRLEADALQRDDFVRLQVTCLVHDPVCPCEWAVSCRRSSVAHRTCGMWGGRDGRDGRAEMLICRCVSA